MTEMYLNFILSYQGGEIYVSKYSNLDSRNKIKSGFLPFFHPNLGFSTLKIAWWTLYTIYASFFFICAYQKQDTHYAWLYSTHEQIQYLLIIHVHLKMSTWALFPSYIFWIATPPVLTQDYKPILYYFKRHFNNRNSIALLNCKMGNFCELSKEFSLQKK